jgi:hypothetical protein
MSKSTSPTTTPPTSPTRSNRSTSRVWINTKVFRSGHRTRNWCATLNNAKETDYSLLENAVGWKVNRKVKITWMAAGVEHGPLRPADWVTPEDYNSEENRQARLNSGELTPHLQMAFQVDKETTWGEITKKLPTLFGLPASALHIEPCQGGLQDQRNYCSKEGNYCEWGEPTEFEPARRSEQGKRSDLEEIQKEIHEGTDIDVLKMKYFGSFASHEGFLTRYAGWFKDSQTKKDLLTDYEQVTWRPWQKTIIDIATGPVKKRTLHVIVDPNGNSGKSFLANWMCLHLNFLLLNPVSKRDMAYILCQHLSTGKSVSGVVIDIARSIVGSGMHEHLPNTSMASVYNFVEALHDGRITNTKYESTTRWFKPPHVFMFTNHPVEIRSEFSLSADRWNVMNLRAGVLVQHTSSSWD